MEPFIIPALLLLIVLAILWAGFSIRRGGGTDAARLLKEQNDALRTELKDSIHDNLSQMNERISAVTLQMQSSTGEINARMENASRVVGEVREGLGALREATDGIFNVGKDIASLQDILKSPKLRGGFGEFLLAELLSEILPSGSFELQYGFKNGGRVDAVIKLSSGMVPVDSKFPMENLKKASDAGDEAEVNSARKRFMADVKKHIDAIASSYILPDEGTFNFALMYIPAENVYYETIIKDGVSSSGVSLSEYAFSKRVVPVSPNSFYAYLQTILLGLKGFSVSKRAEEILASLERLGGEIERLSDDFSVLGTHINNTRTKYDAADKRLAAIGDKLKGLTMDNTE